MALPQRTQPQGPLHGPGRWRPSRSANLRATWAGPRFVAVALLGLALLPGTASAGVVAIQGSTIVFSGESGIDQIAVSDTGLTIRFTPNGGASLGPGPGCDLNLDGESVDCSKSGVTSIALNLDASPDVASVSAGVALPVIFDGGAGADTLTGGGGTDAFFGGAGADVIEARDGRAERISCGADADEARNDFVDTVSGCEHAMLPSLVLAPGTASHAVGEAQALTATLTDSGGRPVQGFQIVFVVAGANPATAARTTDAAGRAGFSYVGRALGTDTVTACFDVNRNRRCDSEERAAAATVGWVPLSPEQVVSQPTVIVKKPPSVRRSRVVRIVLKGGFRPPPGFSRSRVCHGRVFVTLKRKRVVLAFKSVRLNRRCRWRTVLRVRRTRVKNARRLRYTARFGGNERLAAVEQTRTIKVLRK
jgi:hypothetical protein